MTLILKDLFKDDISRYIETVIKADDQNHLISEMKEYVLTQSVATKLQDLFHCYAEVSHGADGPNGVWISGFFGSGKSHLLKMLSYALENRSFGAEKIGEIFHSKTKEFKDLPTLKGDVERCLRIPSESILFNIDQKSDSIGSQQDQSILSVFVKVFNEHCGYSSSHFLAAIERHLEKKGLFEEFKHVYQEMHGSPWEEDRSGLHLVAYDFAAAYSKVANMPLEQAQELFDRYDQKHTVSIEDFAEDVKTYLDSKPAGFRLNLYVDEVGQFIGNNSKLMLNLQTIVETLASKTNKRVWVFVTSQSDLSTAIGDLSSKQSQDYSKINARFSLKIPLTSQNAEEVIRKRLLQKNDTGCEFFGGLYDKEKNNLPTIFHFSDGMDYKLYDSVEQFIHLSPFIPYQSYLFQQCIKGLSDHNAFQGRHQSFGERSMLGVFQLAAKSLSTKPAGSYATYDLFYDGIEGTLRPEVIQLITIARQNMDSPLAIQLLKVLFLVKYTKTFKATPSNISVLMIPSLGVDLSQHEKDVLEALNLLEAQNFVKRSNEGFFEFLTSEEKDIQSEISQITVKNQDITTYVAEYVFKEILTSNKINSELTKQPYEFCRKVDGVLIQRDSTLGIHLISSFFDGVDEPNAMESLSLANNRDLVVRLPDSHDLFREIRLWLRTDKYCKTQHSPTDSRKLILEGLRISNNDREKSLKTRIEKAISESELFFNGARKDVGTVNAKAKLVEGFQILISSVYTNLKLLQGSFTEESVRKYLTLPLSELDRNTALSPSEMEVLNKISRDESSGERPTVDTIIKHFALPPYGWYLAGSAQQLAALLHKSHIEISIDGDDLEPRALANLVFNTSKQSSLVIKRKETIDPKWVKYFKDLHLQLFRINLNESIPQKMIKAFKSQLELEIAEISQACQSLSFIPALSKVQTYLQILQKHSNKPDDYYKITLVKLDDELQDAFEAADKLIGILRNPTQLQILKHALSILDTERNPNLEFLSADLVQNLKTLLNAPNLQIPAIKSCADSLENEEHALIYNERQQFEALFDQISEDAGDLSEADQLSEQELQQALKVWEPALVQIKQTRFISNIRQKHNELGRQGLIKVHSEMTKILSSKVPAPSVTITASPTSPAIPQTASPVAAREVQHPVIKQSLIISAHDISVTKPTRILKSMEDLDTYLQNLRSAYAKELDQGKQISI